MQTRRDHVHAYQFAVSRLSNALTEGDPGTGEAPFRRAGFGVALGIVIALMISAAAAIWGWLDPAASTTWRQQGAIVVEKETGTRYIYLDGVLHPTVNYASALLLAGHGSTVNYVPRSALARVPVGATLGIPGAPQSLPLASALLPGRWSACLAPGRPGGLTLDLRGGLARSLDHARGLVLGPTGADFVVWDNAKYPLPQRSALDALGFGNSVPLPAPASWLDALRTGPALAAPRVPRVGRPGPAVSGSPARIGQLFESVSGGVDQYYVLLADGLAPVSHTEFTLMAAVPGALPPRQLSPAGVAASAVSANGTMLGDLPDVLAGSLYQPSDQGTTLCVRQDSPGRAGRGSLVTEPVAQPGVNVPAGAGMLVQAPAPGFGATSTTYLITAAGKKYPIGGQALSSLGYATGSVRVMPASLLQLVPDGPMLSASLADQAVPWDSG